MEDKKMDKFLDLFAISLPGFIYLLIWMRVGVISDRLSFDEIANNGNTFFAIAFLIFALSNGFFLHVFLQFLKLIIFKPFNWIFKKTFNKNLVDLFDHKIKGEFYYKNKMLWSNNKQQLSEIHSNRSAFWGNISAGAFITFFILQLNYNFSWNNYLIIPIVVFPLSSIAWGHYSNKQIRTVVT